MADVKISNMTAAGSLSGTEIVPVVQGGANKRTTTQAIADLAGSSLVLIDSGSLADLGSHDVSFSDGVIAYIGIISGLQINSVSGHHGLCAAFSFDGSLFLNDTENADSYISEVDEKSQPFTSMTTLGGPDSVMNLTNSLDADSRTNLVLLVFPGLDSIQQPTITVLDGFSLEYSLSGRHRLGGVCYLNAAATVPPGTPARAKTLRIRNYDDADLNSASPRDTFAAGSFAWYAL